MESQIHSIALLALVDEELDELREEYGDLPEKVREKEKKENELRSVVEETENILEEIRKFVSTSKITLVELKNKEEKLSKQQFQVRNNKEFDAITKEISNIREEHSQLTEQLRTEGVKEENLLNILEEQKNNHNEAVEALEEVKSELEILENDQNEEVNELVEKRRKIADTIKKKFLQEYERIREFHPDAAVQVMKNSCSGCFSAIPPQKIVEIRNNQDQLYFCENCGRILYPEEFDITDDDLDEI